MLLRSIAAIAVLFVVLVVSQPAAADSGSSVGFGIGLETAGPARTYGGLGNPAVLEPLFSHPSLRLSVPLGSRMQLDPALRLFHTSRRGPGLAAAGGSGPSTSVESTGAELRTDLKRQFDIRPDLRIGIGGRLGVTYRRLRIQPNDSGGSNVGSLSPFRTISGTAGAVASAEYLPTTQFSIGFETALLASYARRRPTTSRPTAETSRFDLDQQFALVLRAYF